MKRSRTDPYSEEIKKLKANEKNHHLDWLECGVCFTLPRDPADSHCCASGGHFVCKFCFERWQAETSQNGVVSCPTCKERWIPAKNLFRHKYLELHYKLHLANHILEIASSKF